jgi:hypothetical protein
MNSGSTLARAYSNNAISPVKANDQRSLNAAKLAAQDRGASAGSSNSPSASRGIASTGSPEFQIIVEGGLDSQPSMKVVKVLEPSEKDFKDILSSPKSLAEYLMREFKNGAKPGSGVIAIKDRATKQVMFFSVSQNAEGNFIIKSKDPKVRVNTLNNLKLNF